MKIEGVPFATTDWTHVPESVHPGESAPAYWRTVEVGNVRMRMVRYPPGYRANHWCSRGHVLLVLEGELFTELQGGLTYRLTPGMSYHVSSDVAPHRSFTDTGASLFIVD